MTRLGQIYQAYVGGACNRPRSGFRVPGPQDQHRGAGNVACFGES